MTEVTKIYIYRHLLRNMNPGPKANRTEGQKRPPRLKGPRAAAVLARLWVNDDLKLAPTPQKVIAHDLGIGESEVAKMLKDLRNERVGPPCVTLVSNAYARENLYTITPEGKRELEDWILDYSTHGSFLNLIKRIEPNMSSVPPMLTELRKEIKERLGK
jgi:hypothetical protein